MSESEQEGKLKKRVKDLADSYFEIVTTVPEEDMLKMLDEAKKDAPTPDKVLEIAIKRLEPLGNAAHRLEGGLGKAILDCIEADEWREWFKTYFGSAKKP